MNFRSLASLWCRTALTFALAAAISPAFGASVTWNGSADDLWSNAVNWTGGTPALNGIYFNNSGASATSGVVTSIIDQSYAIGSLSFSNTQYQFLQFQTGTNLNITGGLYVGEGGSSNVSVGGVAGGLSLENASNLALSLASGTKRIVIDFDDPDVRTTNYYGLRWKGDHVSQLQAKINQYGYSGDGGIQIVTNGAFVKNATLQISLASENGATYTYLGFNALPNTQVLLGSATSLDPAYLTGNSTLPSSNTTVWSLELRGGSQLNMIGSDRLTAFGGVMVNANAMLNAAGSIAGDVRNSGVMALGSSQRYFHHHHWCQCRRLQRHHHRHEHTDPPGGRTTFTVAFAPSGNTSSTHAAMLRIANDDPDENPFDIALAGQAFSTTADFDGDGLDDWTEYQQGALGFDWQVAQTALVKVYLAGANSTNLYTAAQLADNRTAGRNDVLASPNTYNLVTLDQVQAMNMDAPLIQMDPSSGEFVLTIGLEKSTDLTHFTPFPVTLPQMSITAEGKLQLRFSVPDKTVFFRLGAH